MLSLYVGILFAFESTKLTVSFYSELVNSRNHLNGGCSFSSSFDVINDILDSIAGSKAKDLLDLDAVLSVN